MPRKPIYRRPKHAARGHLFWFPRRSKSRSCFDSSSNVFRHTATSSKQSAQGSREPREVTKDDRRRIFDHFISE